jgi:hypothetical protein
MTLRELLYEYGDRFKIFLNHINDFIEQFSMVLQCNTSILDIPLKNVFIMLFCILYFLCLCGMDTMQHTQHTKERIMVNIIL